MNTIRSARLACLIAVVCVLAANARAQDPYGDAEEILQFQRRLDAYAFQHRQVQRRAGEGADQQAMTGALRAARPAAAEGDFFTPRIAVSFRARIAAAYRTQGCSLGPLRTATAEVPRVGPLTMATGAVPACVLGVLPRLPEELEYRTASVALLLLDTHADLVIDVLHGAFPTP